MLVNRPEFHLVDMAAIHLGATPFSIYNTSSPSRSNHLFSHAQNAVVISEGKFLPVLDAARTPGVRHVISVDGAGDMTLAELERGGGGLRFR